MEEKEGRNVIVLQFQRKRGEYIVLKVPKKEYLDICLTMKENLASILQWGEGTGFQLGPYS